MKFLDGVDAIVHQQLNPEMKLMHVTNCQGVMGRGIAASVRRNYPEVYHYYHTLCMNTPKSSELLGIVASRIDDPVLNLCAQDGFGTDKRRINYGALSNCLAGVADIIRPKGIIMPFEMGCHLAGGDWTVVEEMVLYYFPDVHICKWP